MATGNKPTNRPAGNRDGNRSVNNQGNTKASASNKKAKAKARRKRRRIILVIEIIVLLLLLGVLYFVIKLDKINKTKIDETDVQISDEVKNSETLKGYRNVALFGVDSRDGDLEKGTRSDTMIVASINQETKDVKLVSVYRDTYLDLTNNDYGKCNSAYAAGGPQQAISMMNKNLDLDITDYVSVDFNVMVKVIDLLGGIEIDVQQNEIQHLNNYEVETSKVTGVKTKKVTKTGPQILDGVQAVSYSRIRYTAGDDYKRTERQRTVIQEIIKKAKQADIATLNKIVDEVLPMVSTSFSNVEILELAASVKDYNIAGTEGFPFNKDTTTISGGSCVIPVTLSSNVSMLHDYLFPDETYTVSSTVQDISSKVAKKSGISGDGTEPTTYTADDAAAVTEQDTTSATEDDSTSKTDDSSTDSEE